MERNDVLSSGKTSLFNSFAKTASRLTGMPAAFALAAIVVLVWAISGPFFGFNDSWQLMINTGTTIITFLMVFLIQNAQYRDTAAVQIKLDELIRALEGAHNALLDLEELDDKHLDRIRADYERLAAEARKKLEKGGNDTNVPDVHTE